MNSVWLIRVTFIDDAQYSARAQPSHEMEYAQEAFVELANAMGRMAVRRIHIIVPAGIQAFMSIDDPRIWEITYIRGLDQFDIDLDRFSTNPTIISQLTRICTGQHV